MPTFITRNATVVSLKQLEEDSKPPADAKAPAGPMAPVGECPGQKIALYRYATKAQPKQQIPRTNSIDSITVVPDVDNIRYAACLNCEKAWPEYRRVHSPRLISVQSPPATST